MKNVYTRLILLLDLLTKPPLELRGFKRRFKFVFIQIFGMRIPTAEGPRINYCLEAILKDPDVWRYGYNPQTRQVQVTIRARPLHSPLQNVSRFGDTLYEGVISLGYARELTQRGDIEHIDAPIPPWE